ncbi:hypothetical protein COY23_04195 [bacterium (Candidatus Torokbacteria) CG_4_10_14_0_2_um_filter_35_8]|nr:MAG: hypothetical protein COY23_04195 [bacterium (Candidatus Torokbacteria) CG_4_10_14_0_2_um_filter_35_8]
MILQVLVITSSLLIIVNLISKFKKGSLTLKETAFWVILWLSVIIVFLFPSITSTLAQILGITRGADLIIYIAILVLSYLVFKIFLKMEKIERDITKIVRDKSLKQIKHEKAKRQKHQN